MFRESVRSLHPPRVELGIWVALIYAAVAMVLIQYVGKTNFYFSDVDPGVLEKVQRDPSVKNSIIFASKMWWVGFGVTVYFVLPFLWIKARGESLRDYGIRRPSSYGHMWVYVAMMAVVAVMAYYASFKPSFLKTYPYFKPYLESPDLYAWFWVGRSVRFFALEFFFRGYLLFALQKKFGDSAILISMVPYCMLHFGKPMPETIFAIVGGIIFGWIALRTKSIWGAVILHVFLAMSMDFFAIAQKEGWIGG